MKIEPKPAHYQAGLDLAERAISAETHAGAACARIDVCWHLLRTADGPARSVDLYRHGSKPYESAAAPTPILNPAQPWTYKTT